MMMRKITIALAALTWFVTGAMADILTTGAGRGAPVAAGGCSQATAFLARTSGLNGTHTTAYTTLICNLVTQGVFAKLDGLYMMATQDTATGKLNLIQNAFNFTPTGPPTFTADQGYTGDNTTHPFLDTGFTPGTSTGSYALNSASLGIWTRTGPSATTGNDSGMLAGDTSVTAFITNGSFSTTLIGTRINSAFTGTDDIQATGTGAGFSVGNRSASNAVQLYHNGSSVGTSATASVSLASAASLTFLARNFGGSPNQQSDEQMAAAVFGGSLSSTEQGNLCHELGAFLFTVGAIGSNPC